MKVELKLMVEDNSNNNKDNDDASSTQTSEDRKKKYSTCKIAKLHGRTQKIF